MRKGDVIKLILHPVSCCCKVKWGCFPSAIINVGEVDFIPSKMTLGLRTNYGGKGEEYQEKINAMD